LGTRDSVAARHRRLRRLRGTWMCKCCGRMDAQEQPPSLHRCAVRSVGARDNKLASSCGSALARDGCRLSAVGRRSLRTIALRDAMRLAAQHWGVQVALHALRSPRVGAPGIHAFRTTCASMHIAVCARAAVIAPLTAGRLHRSHALLRVQSVRRARQAGVSTPSLRSGVKNADQADPGFTGMIVRKIKVARTALHQRCRKSSNA